MKEYNAEEIIRNFKPEAIDCDDIGNVLIRDQFSGMDFWFNVYTKNGEVIYEWNQYIFLENDVEDMLRKDIQADNNVCEMCMGCSLDYLIKERHIYEDKKGNCYLSLAYARNEKKNGRYIITKVAACNCLKKDGTPKKRLRALDNLIFTLMEQ